MLLGCGDDGASQRRAGEALLQLQSRRTRTFRSPLAIDRPFPRSSELTPTPQSVLQPHRPTVDGADAAADRHRAKFAPTSMMAASKSRHSGRESNVMHQEQKPMQSRPPDKQDHKASRFAALKTHPESSHSPGFFNGIDPKPSFRSRGVGDYFCILFREVFK